MTLAGRRIGVLERAHPPGYQGALVDQLVPLLEDRGAAVEIVYAENRCHRLDVAPPWDLIVLKSKSVSALHVAAAAESWGIQCINSSAATRLARDKVATSVLLQGAGVPIARSHLAWLPPDGGRPDVTRRLSRMADRPIVVKAHDGSRGSGVWTAQTDDLPRLAARLPPGPYLLMDRVPALGDDLKVFSAGGWMAAVERPFPATTLAAKRGRRVSVPDAAAQATRDVARLLGLSCFGCDFVRGPDGFVLVDVNAFPGYKGADEAAWAIVGEIEKAAVSGGRPAFAPDP